VTKAGKTVAGMRSNPQGWTIADVERVCAHLGLACTPPKRGSHYKISHPELPEILTVPFKRPIKPVYVRELLRMIERLEQKK
jgi:predicted RNA binding protein YcfA (HicA-like mRNA interferase family)